MSDLYNESHKQLVNLVRWLATPMFVVSRDKMMEFSEIKSEPGLLISEDAMKGVQEFRPIPDNVRDEILLTFCRSHERLVP